MLSLLEIQEEADQSYPNGLAEYFDLENGKPIQDAVMMNDGRTGKAIPWGDLLAALIVAEIYDGYDENDEYSLDAIAGALDEDARELKRLADTIRGLGENE